MIASLKKCYTFECVNQHWTCKRIPSVPRCLFRPFIAIYGYLVPFLICMRFNKSLDNGVMLTPKRRALSSPKLFFRCKICCEVWTFTTKPKKTLLLKSLEIKPWHRKVNRRKRRNSSSVFHGNYPKCSNNQRITPIKVDSNFTARETQDYAPSHCQATNSQANSYNFKTLKWIGHFRVLLSLFFKTSLSAKPFLWKWVLHAVSFSCKSKSFL